MKLNLTGNPKGVQILIVIVLALTLWFAFKAKRVAAEEAAPVFFAAGGAVLSGSEPYTHGLRVGMEQGSWQMSVVTSGEGHITKPEARYWIAANIGVCGTFHRELGRWSIGWGGCLFEHGDVSIGDYNELQSAEDGAVWMEDDSIQVTAAITARFSINRHVFIELPFHVSTGGSTHYNKGRNSLLVGVRF